MITKLIKDFSGGIANNKRLGSAGAASRITNFDSLTFPDRLVPRRSSEDGESNASNSQIQMFQVALGSGATERLFGLGVVTGTGRAKVFYKNLTTGASTDLDDAGWTETTNAESASGATSFDMFVYYRKTGLIYGARANTHFWAYDPTAGTSFDDTELARSYTTVAQGIVHSKDDILYLPHDEYITKNNNGSWTTEAIALPTKYYITSICEYGNYLAIACAPKNGIGSSRVFLWDRDSTLTTLSESIDWGEGVLKIIEEVDGVLVGVSFVGANSTVFSDRAVFRALNGSQAVQLSEYYLGVSAQLPIKKQVFNNRLHFLMKGTLNGDLVEGVFSFGRLSSGQPFSLVHEYTPNNDTATTNGVLKGFFILGDFIFIAYVSSTVHAVSKTNDTETYIATSTFTSLINPEMERLDGIKKKKLYACGATYEPLPSGAQVVMKVSVDGGAFTTVFTESTDGQVVTEQPLTTSGTTINDGREFRFMLESTGGAQITGYWYKYQTLETHI
jgi:hypothetical protein